MDSNEVGRKEKIKRVLKVIIVIWLLKIFLCVVVREYQNDNILWEYENSRFSSEFLASGMAKR